MKIFIIDDDPISIFFTEKVIQLQRSEWQPQVQTFLSAEEALTHLQQADLEELPEVILLDLNMPHVNGWEFLAALEQLPQDKPLEKCGIYVLTSSLATSDMAKAQEYGTVKGFLHKPIGLEDIQAIFDLN